MSPRDGSPSGDRVSQCNRYWPGGGASPEANRTSTALSSLGASVCIVRPPAVITTFDAA